MDGRTQSRLLWDTRTSGLSCSALPVVTLAWGTSPADNPSPAAAQKSALCVSVQDIATVALGAVEKIRGACDVGKRFLLQPLWQVNCC